MEEINVQNGAEESSGHDEGHMGLSRLVARGGSVVCEAGMVRPFDSAWLRCTPIRWRSRSRSFAALIQKHDQSVFFTTLPTQQA